MIFTEFVDNEEVVDNFGRFNDYMIHFKMMISH